MGRAYLGEFEQFMRGKDYYVSSLKLKVRESITSGRNVMDVSVNEYFKLIFCFNSEVFGHNTDCAEIKTSSTTRIEEYIRADARNRGKSIINGGYNTQILQYEYIEYQLRRKNKHYYKDLVELSASFD